MPCSADRLPSAMASWMAAKPPPSVPMMAPSEISPVVVACAVASISTEETVWASTSPSST